MKICIPTYKRVDLQITLNQIPKILYPDTFLICTKEEENLLKKYNIQLIVLPDNVKGIGNIRQYIVENLKTDFIWFLDDDLIFYRREINKTKLLKIKDADFIELYNWNKKCLEKGYAIVGCSAQGGNNRFKGKFTFFGRIYASYALNSKILKKHNIKFNEMEVMEDFNVVLHLLRFGYKSIINTEFAHNQKASNQAGGCSEFRTYDLQKKSAFLLSEKHKPFVSVVKKESKNWVGMKHRFDVKIFWKKAFEQGRYRIK
tara:strand:+ start:5 stop:778 length:774 start_codon:yes stop_codon:yes gene_type:complete